MKSKRRSAWLSRLSYTCASVCILSCGLCAIGTVYRVAGNTTALNIAPEALTSVDCFVWPDRTSILIDVDPTGPMSWVDCVIPITIPPCDFAVPTVAPYVRVSMPSLEVGLCAALLAIGCSVVQRTNSDSDFGHCDCGYDLTGNLSGVCPECGRRSEDSQPPRAGP